MSNDWGRIAISTRLYGPVPPEFLSAWTGLVAGGLRPGDAVIAPPVGYPQHEAGNQVVRQFRGLDMFASCDTLLFIDHDHTFRPDTLARLRDDPRGFEHDVMGALYISRMSRKPSMFRLRDDATDVDPTFDAIMEWEPGAVVPVDVLGLGFTMIRRRVLEFMYDPWFWYHSAIHSEDVAFCGAARKAGFSLAVNTAVTIGHLVTQSLEVGGR